MSNANPAAPPTQQARGYSAGFWAVAFAFLIVMAFATLPSPLYGLYRTRDDLSAFTITVVYAIFAAGTIAALRSVPFIAARIGRRGVMLAAVATMIVAAGVLAAWKALPGLLVGRLITGVSVGLAAGTAITYLIELRLRDDPSASPIPARNIGTAVNVGALGIGPLVAGFLAQWVSHPLTVPYLLVVALGVIALIGLAAAPETGTRNPAPTAQNRPSGSSDSIRILVPAAATTLAAFSANGLFSASRVLVLGTVSMLVGLVLLVTAVRLSTPSLALFLISGALIGAGAGAVFKGTTGLVLAATPPEGRLAITSDLLVALFVGLSIPVIGAGIALDRGADAPDTVLGFAIVVAVGVAGAGTLLGRELRSRGQTQGATNG